MADPGEARNALDLEAISGIPWGSNEYLKMYGESAWKDIHFSNLCSREKIHELYVYRH